MLNTRKKEEMRKQHMGEAKDGFETREEMLNTREKEEMRKQHMGEAKYGFETGGKC